MSLIQFISVGALVATLILTHSVPISGTGWSSKKTFSWIACGSVDGGAGLAYGVCEYVLLSSLVD